jgi:hypothetical protein
MPVISLTGVGRRYGRYQALADVTADIGTPTITGEAAELLDRVLVIDHGRVVLDAPADDLRGAGTIVTGPADRVERFVADRPTLNQRTMGGHATGPGATTTMEHCRCPDHHDAPSSWLASLCPGRRNAAGTSAAPCVPPFRKKRTRGHSTSLRIFCRESFCSRR